MNPVRNENFMRHFRWLTPLFLFLLNIIIAMTLYIAKGYLTQLEDMRLDLNRVQSDVTNIKVDISYIKGREDK